MDKNSKWIWAVWKYEYEWMNEYKWINEDKMNKLIWMWIWADEYEYE